MLSNEKNVKRMMDDIQMEVAYTRSATGIKQFRQSVLHAMQTVPRHKFVPEALHDLAYHNGPLSIGHGQTISQPYIVALMTDLLEPESDDVILEVGTGSGYQSAILANIVQKVYSIEIVPELAQEAEQRFNNLNITNIETKSGDGYYGWPEHAPYDGIIVTAAAPYVPEPLVEQLKIGAKLVIPVGRPYMHQELIVVEKTADGQTQTKDILAVAFVPLTGTHKKN
ncbi:protein-L-isoaspartate(D-aspartate) O-methyltransferase [Kaarinaea lacus]